MQRVLSSQLGMTAGRGFGESSEFVTKRMCFSFIFFFGFLSLLGGFLFGRMSTERNYEIREERKCLKLAEDVLEVTGRPKIQYNILLQELRNITFQQFPHHLTNKSEKYITTGDAADDDDHHIDHETLKTILSDSGLFDKVLKQKSNVIATLRGFREPDRWIILSVSGNETIQLALELVKIFEKLKVDHNWEPRRTIIFCFFNEPHDSCRDDMLSNYSKSRIFAYLTVHGNAIQKKGCLITSGSDITQSIVLSTVQESISTLNSDDNQIFDDSCKIQDDKTQRQIFLPRIFSDVPHTSLSFKSISNSTNTDHFGNKIEMLPYRKILIQIIGRSIWELSESAILQWDPKDFQRGVKTALKMINSLEFNEIKEKIASTTMKLVNIAGSFFNQRTNSTELKDPGSLAIRMTNDLLIDLDRALLCPDVDSRSKTDLSMIPKLLSMNPREKILISSFLVNLLKCYEDAVEILQEG